MDICAPVGVSISTACSDPTTLIDKSRIRGAALEITEIRDLLLVADRAAEWREIALHPAANLARELASGTRAFAKHRGLHAAAATFP